MAEVTSITIQIGSDGAVKKRFSGPLRFEALRPELIRAGTCGA